MPSPLILCIVLAAVGLYLIINGIIVVSSIGKLSGDDRAKNNVKYTGGVNIFTGGILLGIAAYLGNKSREKDSLGEIHSAIPMVGVILLGVYLFITGMIIRIETAKLSGDDKAAENIKNVGEWPSIGVGVCLMVGGIAGIVIDNRLEKAKKSPAATPDTDSDKNKVASSPISTASQWLNNDSPSKTESPLINNNSPITSEYTNEGVDNGPLR